MTGNAGSIMATKRPFTVCVFCEGASQGLSPEYAEATTALAKVLHSQAWSLVYGGGTYGLMGNLAKSLVQLSGPESVHGVIPGALIRTERGVIEPNVSEYGRTSVVRDMHERKATMATNADAFVALPGGYGTMEELFEVVTWNQLGRQAHPVVLLNINGFFNHILAWINHAVEEGFISKGTRDIISVADRPEDVVSKIRQYKLAAGRHILDWDSKL
ncbi:hypothetical protein PspLS_08797 [Pyricularia sp. CBS 133598]|nr:hypothetical protein PspLS_08797 [Pyricularia sp. CBS 133598]